jgi:hypothetical protein
MTLARRYLGNEIRLGRRTDRVKLSLTLDADGFGAQRASFGVLNRF